MKKRVFIIASLLILLALALVTGSILLLRLFFLVVLVLLLSYFWVLLSSRGLSGQVKISAERCQAGERFGEEATVSSSSRLPKLLITAEENTDLPGHQNAAVFNLSPKSSHRWQTEVYCRRRGRYNLGNITATVTDPFGFFSMQRNFGEPRSVLVYPATQELPFFQPLSHSSEPISGSSRWLMNEIGPNAARVREYVNGDTLNRIHWHSTAHTNKLMVKEFDADRSSYASKNIWIVLDMQQATQAGEGDESTEEYGVTIAASLIRKYLDSDKQVGLMATGDQSYIFLPQMGEEHLRRMLEALALIKATGEVPVEQLISSEVERFGNNSIIIVITPSTNEQVVAALRRLKSRGAIVIVISLDSASFTGPAGIVNTTGKPFYSDFQVYTVRHGEELAGALDSRALIPQMRYLGELV